MDRLKTRKDALNRIETYDYDPAGNLSQFTDRKNQQSTFQYDALNRRTQATYADATVSFTYDSVGRLTRAADSVSGTIELSRPRVRQRVSREPQRGFFNGSLDSTDLRAPRVMPHMRFSVIANEFLHPQWWRNWLRADHSRTTKALVGQHSRYQVGGYPASRCYHGGDPCGMVFQVLAQETPR